MQTGIDVLPPAAPSGKARSRLVWRPVPVSQGDWAIRVFSTGTPENQLRVSVIQAPPQEGQSARSTEALVRLLAKWGDFCEGLFRDLSVQAPRELAELVNRNDLRPARMTTAAEVLGSLADDALVVGPLMKVLAQNQSSLAREGAVLGLSHHLRDDKVKQLLRRVAEHDPSPGVRAAALDVLAETQD